MEDFTNYSLASVEFQPLIKPKEQTQFKDSETDTDPLSAQFDKAIETNIKCNAETQKQTIIVDSVHVDVPKLGKWLKKVYPLEESEILEGPTSLPSDQILNFNQDYYKLKIQPYQKLTIASKENHKGLATWLSIYTLNTSVLVLTTSVVHDDWCEHVDQNIKVYIPKRISQSRFVAFEELKKITIKACLETLSTNPFHKELFAGSTVSGDLYMWKFVQNKGQPDIKELFCENLPHGCAVGFDWPSKDHFLTCHANGWVCLWSIGKYFVKEGEYFIQNDRHSKLKLTTIASITLTDFVVGCANGALYHCSDTNMRTSKSEIQIMKIKSHKFSVSSLLKRELQGKSILISCDLGGEVFVHDFLSSDHEDKNTILRVPLPFQSNIICSKDGEVIFCPGADGSLKAYGFNNGKQSNVTGVLKGKGNMIKTSDNGLWIVTGSYEGDFQIFSVTEK